MSVQSPKAHVIGLVEEMPDDSSYDEIFQELVFARMVLRGLSDVKEGRTIGDKEMQRTIDSWAAGRTSPPRPSKPRSTSGRSAP